jgi:hypothetical protein
MIFPYVFLYLIGLLEIEQKNVWSEVNDRERERTKYLVAYFIVICRKIMTVTLSCVDVHVVTFSFVYFLEVKYLFIINYSGC